MTITSIPLQTESAGQLGKSKSDGTGVYDADTKISAAQWNQVVLRLIQAFQEIGLSDGTTGGSLREAVNAAAVQVAHTFVRLAATANVADLTTLCNGGTLDGKTLATGDRIFLPYQSTAAQGKIYTVNASGAPTAADDWDAAADVSRGALVSVTTGDTNGGTIFVVWCSPGTTTPNVIGHVRQHSAGTGVTMSAAGQIAADISGSAAADVGTAGSAGSSGKLIHSDHVHALTRPTLASVLAGGSVDVTGSATVVTSDDIILQSNSGNITLDTETGDISAVSAGGVAVSAIAGDVSINASGAVNLAPGASGTDFNNQKGTRLADPTAATNVANARYADQPPTRTDSTTTPAITSADIGGVLILSNAGSITLTTLNLSGSLRSGGAIPVTVILTGGGTLTIADGSGCSHSGSPSGTSAFLVTVNGTTWYVR